MRYYDVRHNGVCHSGMRHFTISPSDQIPTTMSCYLGFKKSIFSKLLESFKPLKIATLKKGAELIFEAAKSFLSLIR
jgi:hypothetical protein